MNRVYHNKRFKRHNQKARKGDYKKERMEEDQYESDRRILIALGTPRPCPYEEEVHMPYWREQYRERFGNDPKFLYTYTGYIKEGE